MLNRQRARALEMISVNVAFTEIINSRNFQFNLIHFSFFAEIWWYKAFLVTPQVSWPDFPVFLTNKKYHKCLKFQRIRAWLTFFFALHIIWKHHKPFSQHITLQWATVTRARTQSILLILRKFAFYVLCYFLAISDLQNLEKACFLELAHMKKVDS